MEYMEYVGCLIWGFIDGDLQTNVGVKMAIWKKVSRFYAREGENKNPFAQENDNSQ